MFRFSLPDGLIVYHILRLSHPAGCASFFLKQPQTTSSLYTSNTYLHAYTSIEPLRPLLASLSMMVSGFCYPHVRMRWGLACIVGIRIVRAIVYCIVRIGLSVSVPSSSKFNGFGFLISKFPVIQGGWVLEIFVSCFGVLRWSGVRWGRGSL